MTENAIVKNEQQRDISIVTAEIKDICTQARRMVLISAVEIGRRLVEAKEILPHGEWGNWLKNEVQFSQSTANKHMKVFEKFGSKQMSLFGAELNSETFTNLSYSQALKLLSVPDDELEEFVEDNNIADKSVREIDRLIKERDDAVKERDAALEQAALAEEYETELNKLRAEAEESKAKVDKLTDKGIEFASQINDLNDKLIKSKEAEKKAKAKLKELKENPTVPQEQIDKLRAEAEEKAAQTKAKEIEDALAELKKKLEAAEEEEMKARRTADAANAKIAELEKKSRMSDPAVMEFRVLFNQLQETASKAKDNIAKIQDEDIANKFKQALREFAKRLED